MRSGSLAPRRRLLLQAATVALGVPGIVKAARAPLVAWFAVAGAKALRRIGEWAESGLLRGFAQRDGSLTHTVTQLNDRRDDDQGLYISAEGDRLQPGAVPALRRARLHLCFSDPFLAMTQSLRLQLQQLRAGRPARRHPGELPLAQRWMIAGLAAGGVKG
jgi:hypothetical protein